MIGKRRRLEILKTCHCAEVGGNARGSGRDGRCFVLERCKPDGRLRARFRLSWPRVSPPRDRAARCFFCDRLHARAVAFGAISRPTRVRTLAQHTRLGRGCVGRAAEWIQLHDSDLGLTVTPTKTQATGNRWVNRCFSRRGNPYRRSELANDGPAQAGRSGEAQENRDVKEPALKRVPNMDQTSRRLFA